MKSISRKQAVSLLKEWQEILRLQDWDVELVILKRTEAGPGRISRGKYNAAIMTICQPSGIPEDFIGVNDPEVTIVHELLHLYGWRFDHRVKDESEEDNGYELMIERTAQALVYLKRLSQPKNGTINPLLAS